LIDSLSVKGADTVGSDTRGCDARKKVNGRKQFIVTNTFGLLLTTVVLSAAVQDRDGAKPALLQAHLHRGAVHPPDGFVGRLMDWAQQILRTTTRPSPRP
jgi:hypothetical protein